MPKIVGARGIWAAERRFPQMRETHIVPPEVLAYFDGIHEVQGVPVKKWVHYYESENSYWAFTAPIESRIEAPFVEMCKDAIVRE